MLSAGNVEVLNHEISRAFQPFDKLMTWYNRLSRVYRQTTGFGLFLIRYAAFLFSVMPFVSEAAVTGNCVDCHTMHNSQNGVHMQILAPGETLTDAREILLRGSCLGCHGAGPGSIKDNGGNGIPQVLHSDSDLAAGNFGYITGMKIPTSGDSNTVGHNVIELGSNDTVLTSPPGDQHATGITNANFTCSGAKGCHGDRAVEGGMASLRGAHHGDDRVLKFGQIDENAQGSSVALSYRFLKGVKGGEDSDWQKTVGTTDHNEYKGALSMGTSLPTEPVNNTVSGFCAECHGYYHGTMTDESGTLSPWVRHPTDISLPSRSEYLSHTTYNLTVPVARTFIPNGPSSDVTPAGTTDDIVMCLSCHRAHASPYFKMLRWDYKSSSLGTALSGCMVCHTSKN